MQFTQITLVTLSSLLALAAASPAPVAAPENLSLFNGKDIVEVTTGGPQARSVKSILQVRDNVNCDGSAFCERLGESCDVAVRQLVPNSVYDTNGEYV